MRDIGGWDIRVDLDGLMAGGFAGGGVVDGPEDPVNKAREARWMANRPFANTTVDDARRMQYKAERAAALNRNTYNARNVSDNTSVRNIVPESVVLPTGETVMKDEPEQDNIVGLVSQTRLGRIESPVVDPIHDEPSGRMDTPVIDFLYGMTPWELAYYLKDSFGELKDNGFGEGRGLNAALSVASILPLGKIGKIAKNEEKILSKMSKWSPEKWTAAQDAAIARSDMAEAQRLRDLHFLTKSNTSVLDEYGMPLRTYHGSPNTDIKEFRHVPPRTGGRGTGTEGFYVTSSKSYADRYRAKHLMRPSDLDNGRIYDLYVNAKKVATFPDDFPNNTRISFINNMNAPERAFLENNGYDGIKLGKFLNNSTGERPEMAVLNPNQLKLADAVTYDDNGIRIPLGLRDNFKIGDIRYAIAPFLAGGIGLYNTKNK